MGGTRKRLLAGLGALAVTIGGASFAWACSGQSVVVFGGASSSASGPADAVVDVTGSRWEAAPVQVRWNSATGPELEASPAPVGPSFSVKVKIPANATTGVHTVYFIQYERDLATTDPGGKTSITGTARLPFEVTPAGSDVRYSPGDADAATRTSASTSGGDESPGSQATSGASAGEGEFSTGTGQRTGSASGGDAAGAPSAPLSQSFGNLPPTSGAAAPTSGTAAPAAGRSATVAPQTTAAGEPTAVSTGQVQPVFGGSVAPGGSAVALGAPLDEAQASARSATGDVWAGFEPGNGSLVPSLADTAGGSTAPGSSLAVGVGLLSAGIGMLFGGFGIAEVRRQRALARQG